MPTLTTYGWQSKKYLFGANYSGDVATAVQSGSPGRILCTAACYAAPTDRVRIIARLGGTSELVLLDRTGAVDAVNLLDQEVNLGNFANVLPASDANWYVDFRVEISTPYKDPTPESVDWPFIDNDTVTLYLYRDLVTQSVVVRTDPMDSGTTRAGTPVTSDASRYLPLKRVQTVFYFSDQTVRLRAATVVSDGIGKVSVALPSGAYDIEFYGGNVLESEYLKGYVVGAGTNLSPWKGGTVSGIAQASEYNAIKAQFSTLYWPGYMIAEDFSPERLQYRNEAAETNSYGNNYAYQLFGRVFAGLSYVEFIGIAVDPPPE